MIIVMMVAARSSRRRTTGGLRAIMVEMSMISTQFVSRDKFKVEFLTPNRGSDDLAGNPVQMPALGGAAAFPLRLLDFLIRQPVRAVLLHGAGVPILIPSPERYAVHKLIVASRRKDDRDTATKAVKDRLRAKSRR